MAFSLYRHVLSSEPIGQPPKAISMSEAELEEMKERVIEYAKKTLPAFEANHSYLRENYAELLKQYLTNTLRYTSEDWLPAPLQLKKSSKL